MVVGIQLTRRSVCVKLSNDSLVWIIFIQQLFYVENFTENEILASNETSKNTIKNVLLN